MTLPAAHMLVAAKDDAPPESSDKKPQQDESPEAKMKRRFPQGIRVGDLVCQPVLDDDSHTIGTVTQVVRTPDGKIKLIVAYSRWFGWFPRLGRPVAVPIEVVASLGWLVASVDMQPDEYQKAPTWTEGQDTRIPDDETILIALTRR